MVAIGRRWLQISFSTFVYFSPLIGHSSSLGSSKLILERLCSREEPSVVKEVVCGLTRKEKTAQEVPVERRKRPKNPRTTISFFDDKTSVIFSSMLIFLLFQAPFFLRLIADTRLSPSLLTLHKYESFL